MILTPNEGSFHLAPDDISVFNIITVPYDTELTMVDQYGLDHEQLIHWDSLPLNALSIGLQPSVVRNSITAVCFKCRSMEDAIFLSSDRVAPLSLMTHHILSSNEVTRRCNFAHM